MCDRDINALIIEGEPTELELHKAWQNIRVEYADKMGDNEYKHYLGVFKMLHDLKGKIAITECCLDVLKDKFVPFFARKLNGALGTAMKFDVYNSPSYDKMLKACSNRLISMNLQRDMQMFNFEKLKKKYSSEKSEPTREYYTAMLITLSDNAKFMLNEKTITTLEYCLRVQRSAQMVKAIKAQNRQVNRR